MNDAVITVAADGSLGSQRALEWAMAEASQRGCAVELVASYSAAPSEVPSRSQGRAEQMIRTTLDRVRVECSEQPPVSWKVVEGDPARVLVHESESSQLLVLGADDVRGWWHGAMGSITELCARMSHCPVVIVPPSERPTHDEWPMSVGSD